MKVQLQLGRSALVFLVLLMIPCMASLAFADNISDGVVQWLKFDEGSGTQISDSGSIGFDNCTTNMDWVAGQSGNASDYALYSYNTGNATCNDYYQFGNKSFSVSFWFKRNCSGSANTYISTNYDWISGGAWDFQLGNTAGGGGGHSTFEIGNTDGDGDTPSLSETCTPDTWMHIVGVNDYGGTGNVSLYLNGTLVETLDVSWVGNLDVDSGLPLEFRGNSGNQFAGTIDNFIMYNRSLTDGEITALYSGEEPIVTTTTTTSTTTTVPTTTTTITTPTGEIVDRNVNVVVTLLVVFMVIGIALIIKDQYI